MTEFSIYQINTDRDDNRICFLGLDTLERFQHSKEVDPVLYDRVYDGKLDCNSLETIYEKFNIDHPADYKGRSLSVSDVVEIRESDTLNPGFYFVDSIGFKSISFDKSLWTLSAGSFSLLTHLSMQRGSSPSRLTLRRNTVRNSNTPNAL